MVLPRVERAHIDDKVARSGRAGRRRGRFKFAGPGLDLSVRWLLAVLIPEMKQIVAGLFRNADDQIEKRK